MPAAPAAGVPIVVGLARQEKVRPPDCTSRSRKQSMRQLIEENRRLRVLTEVASAFAPVRCGALLSPSVPIVTVTSIP